MNLITWKKNNEWPNFDPFGFEDGIEHLFQDLMGGSRWDVQAIGRMNPAIDVIEEKDHYLIKADLPGVDKEKINVSVQEDVLVIRGERNEKRELKQKDSVCSERFYGSFERAVRLPSGVDVNKGKGIYKNGVLELTLPKTEEVKAKQIKID